MARLAAGRHRGSMSKRVAAGVLWLFAGWYLGNIVSFHVGISDLFGPIIGVAAAALVAGDPFGRIWPRTTDGTARLVGDARDGAAPVTD